MLHSWDIKRTNNVLLTAIIIVNLYVIMAPVAPAAIFWWQKNHTSRPVQLSQLVQPKHAGTASPAAPTPKQNAVVVPSMLLNTPILEGPVSKTYQILDNGVWRWPDSSTPDKGGNTVLIGHRFTYTDPRGIFYELNQVKVGDPIALFWNSKEYLYTVAHISEVPPSDTGILAQTKQTEVTLYTCTPTWNPIHRLVVVATLQSVRSLAAT